MPKKAKDKDENVEKQITKTKKATKTTTKKVATSASKKTTKASTSSITPNPVKKRTPVTKTKTTSKKTEGKKPTKTASKSNLTKQTRKKQLATSELEYYDLPYQYQKTTVKLLAQTPNTLFIYWNISDEDRNTYLKQYGSTFFEETRPVLMVHNKTMNYTFEVEINDFANSWYLTVNDSKCTYAIELGRRVINKDITFIPDDYIAISSSNTIESPNDRILLEEKQSKVQFKNIKTNVIKEKEKASFAFRKDQDKSYRIYDIYQKIYKEEIKQLDISNPSSHSNPTFK